MDDTGYDNVKNFVVKLPKSAKYEPADFVDFLKTLSRIFKNVPFSLSLNMIEKRIYYGLKVGRGHYSVIENQLYAAFPGIEIDPVKAGLTLGNSHQGAQANLRLRQGDFYPFLKYDQIDGDFLSDIFNQFSRLSAKDLFSFEVKITPIDYDRMLFLMKRNIKLGIKNTKDQLNIFKGIVSKKATADVKQKALQAAQEKNREPLYMAELNLTIFSDSYESAASKLEPIAQVFNKLESEYNEFVHRVGQIGEQEMEQLGDLSFSKKALYLSASEIGTILHFPSNTDAVPNLYKILAPKAEPPIGLPTLENTPSEELCLFGKTNYRNIREEFGIKRKDRARHMYFIGKSGVGKSKLLELLIKGDIEGGHGVCVIDPHGDLIENIIPFIPENRVKDVIYFNAPDEKFPISFNPIEKVDKVYRQQVATGLIETFKKIFGANWTPRLEHVMRMTLLALLDAPKASIMSVLLLLTDRDYRQEVIKTIDDQVVKNFWTNEFAGWSEKFDSEAIMPILNKIGQFVSNSIIRNIVGQEENKIVMPDIMDGKKILLVKLPKGILGEENTALLGSMMVTKIYQSALARADIPEKDRVPFYLYVDEFQNFATDSFSNILSESRKYKLSLSIAHQYVSQLSDVIKKTVFGNVGTIVSFRLGPEDAALLEQEFEPKFKAADITNLGVQEIYLKMSIDDEVKDAFSARTLTVPEPEHNLKDAIVKYTRENYCKDRSQAEGEIKKEKSKEMEVLEKLKNEDFSAPIL